MMTKMIREHFNLIAKALHKTKPTLVFGLSVIREVQWENDVNALAEVLQQTNERFDKERFINACKEGVS